MFRSENKRTRKAKNTAVAYWTFARLPTGSERARARIQRSNLIWKSFINAITVIILCILYLILCWWYCLFAHFSHGLFFLHRLQLHIHFQALSKCDDKTISLHSVKQPTQLKPYQCISVYIISVRMCVALLSRFDLNKFNGGLMNMSFLSIIYYLSQRMWILWYVQENSVQHTE